MPRRLISAMVSTRGGPRRGGSSIEVRVYDDKDLVTLSTLFPTDTSATTLPNPITPNAGANTDLTVQTAINDALITVRDISDFAVGNEVPIYDGTVTKYHVVTQVLAGSKQLRLEPLIDRVWTVGPTLVGNQDVEGHIMAWVDQARDYYFQVKETGSARLLPKLTWMAQIPTSTIAVQDEGTLVGTRGTLNVKGIGIKATDDAGNSRVNITHAHEDLWTAGVL